MKPAVEFFIACILLLAGGCSAIAGILSANIWTSVFAAGSIIALIMLLTYGTKSKQ